MSVSCTCARVSKYRSWHMAMQDCSRLSSLSPWATKQNQQRCCRPKRKDMLDRVPRPVCGPWSTSNEEFFSSEVHSVLTHRCSGTFVEACRDHSFHHFCDIEWMSMRIDILVGPSGVREHVWCVQYLPCITAWLACCCAWAKTAWRCSGESWFNWDCKSLIISKEIKVIRWITKMFIVNVI